MPEQPIIPSRIIPSGDTGIPRMTYPTAPAGATDLPPWRTAAPAPAPAPAESAPVPEQESAPAAGDDWWDQLYGTPEDNPAPRSRTRKVTGRPGRLPDWRTGQVADLTKDKGKEEEEEEEEEECEEEGDEKKGKGKKKSPDGEDGEERPEGEGPSEEEGEERKSPPSVRIGRVVVSLPSWLTYNAAALAISHWGAQAVGHDWSLPVHVHDLCIRYSLPPYHPSTGLTFGALAFAVTWLVLDRPTRRGWVLIHMPIRALLAGIAGGTLAASWPYLVHHLTGAPQ